MRGAECRVSGSAAETDNASNGGPDLLETWLILEYCDQGSFDHAIRSGKFTKDLVRASSKSACMHCWHIQAHALAMRPVLNGGGECNSWPFFINYCLPPLPKHSFPVLHPIELLHCLRIPGIASQ